MAISATHQALVFSLCIAGGFILGVLFDIFRIIRRAVNAGNVVTGVLDFLFWVLAAVLVFGTIFIINNGEVRAYEFLALALGLVLYFVCISRAFVRFSLFLIKWTKKIVTAVCRILFFPVKWILKALRVSVITVWSPVKGGLRFFKKLFAKMWERLEKSCQNFRKRLKKV